MNYNTMATTTDDDIHGTMPSTTTTTTASSISAPPLHPSGTHLTITTRTLRNLPFYTFPPAFIFLLAHGIATAEPFPALTLIPTAGSCLLSLALGAGVLQRLHVPVDRQASVAFVVEALLAVLYFCLLVPSWVSLDDGRGWRGNPVLGTYATVPVMVNL